MYEEIMNFLHSETNVLSEYTREDVSYMITL